MHRPESTARLRPDARSAFGLYASALHDGSEHGQRVARGLKQEILAAPQDRGLFPTRFSVQRDEWDGCNFGAAAAYYHTAECSEQLYWLLKWYQSFEKDKSILRYARRYADFLIEARLRTGEIPSWYALDHHPLYPLRSGTQTAASAMFLAEMGRATGHAKYINAAERSARFVLKELTSGSAYQDCTLMSRTGGFRLECKDPHTRQCPQSAQAMLWVARLCLDLHLAGAGSAYLSQGLGALDHLCMLQAVWSKPWNDWEEAGLLAASNVGVTYDAELTAEFARCAMDYGIATGEREYCQRAAAALSSAEAAAGRDQVRQSKVAASRMLVEGTHGTAYVHVGRKWAVSTNGWSIENLDFGRGIIKMTISGKAEESDRLVFGGMRAANYRISINGRVRTHTREELEAGITLSMRQPPLPLL